MKKIIVGIMTFVLLFTVNPMIARAEEVDLTDTYILETNGVKHTVVTEFEELDQYIRVKENKYYLDLPSGVTLDAKTREYANENLINSNTFIEEENKQINLLTKSFDEEIIHGISRAHGVTKIQFNWNYARLWISATFIKVLVGVTVSAVLGYLGFHAGPFASAVLSSIGFIAGMLFDGIRHGYRMDIDYFLPFIGKPAAHNIVRQ